MIFLNTLLRSTSATAIAANSAIGNASQISVSAFSIIEKIFASGITTTSSLSSDITRELMPHPSAWNTPCRAMLAPAKRNPVDMMRIDDIQSAAVVSDRPNITTSGPANTCSSIIPAAMIASTYIRPYLMPSSTRFLLPMP